MTGFMEQVSKAFKCLASVVASGARPAKVIEYASYCVAAKLLEWVGSGRAESLQKLGDLTLREITAESKQRIAKAEVGANRQRLSQVEEAKVRDANASARVKELKGDKLAAEIRKLDAETDAQKATTLMGLLTFMSAIKQHGGQPLFDEQNLKAITEHRQRPTDPKLEGGPSEEGDGGIGEPGSKEAEQA